MCFIEQSNQPIPSGIENCIRIPQSRRDEPQIGSLRNFLLDRFAEQQGGEEPLKTVLPPYASAN
jgi:hypothetical protein